MICSFLWLGAATKVFFLADTLPDFRHSTHHIDVFQFILTFTRVNDIITDKKWVFY
jgi:hypothetical protein